MRDVCVSLIGICEDSGTDNVAKVSFQFFSERFRGFLSELRRLLQLPRVDYFRFRFFVNGAGFLIFVVETGLLFRFQNAIDVEGTGNVPSLNDVGRVVTSDALRRVRERRGAVDLIQLVGGEQVGCGRHLLRDEDRSGGAGSVGRVIDSHRKQST